MENIDSMHTDSSFQKKGMNHRDGQIPKIEFEFGNSKNDEFDIDKIEFTALNKGLGFHHETERPLMPSLAKKKVEFNTIHHETKISSIPLNNKKDPLLKSIYGETPLTQNFENLGQFEVNVPLEEKTFLKEGLPIKRSLAFLLDNFIIFLISWGILKLGLMVVGFNISLKLFLTNGNLGPLILTSLFVVFFLSYFTIFDLAQTLGKMMFNLKVVSVDDSNLHLDTVLFRTFIGLISVVLFFFPFVLNLPDKICDTKVVSTN